MSFITVFSLTVDMRQNNPLHISVFPPHEGSRFRFTLFLNSCLDIFAIRQQHVSVDQDLGLLHAFDERFAAYGWLANTGVKFVAIVDAMGKDASGSAEDSMNKMPLPGVHEADLKSASIHYLPSCASIRSHACSHPGIPLSPDRIH